MVRALEAALAGEHLVACQMLPPLVESCVRRVFAARGLDTISFRPQNGGRMQERTMGALFDDDPESPLVAEARRVLGLNLWHWYRAVMFDELGMNLRNRGAHGLLRDDECVQSTTEILLLAVVALLRVSGSCPVVQVE
jgi:hypothetical protein